MRAIPRTNESEVTSSGGSMTKISEHFWRLDTSFDERRLIFFGATEAEVLGKYRAYMRRWELEKVR